MHINNTSIRELSHIAVNDFNAERAVHNEQIVDAFCSSSQRASMYKGLLQEIGRIQGFDSHLAIGFLLDWQLKSTDNAVPAIQLLRECRVGFIDAYAGLAENAGFNDSIIKCCNVLSQAGVHVSEDWVMQMFFKPDFEDSNSSNAANILALKLQQDLLGLFNDWLSDASDTQAIQDIKTYLKLTQEHLSVFLNKEKPSDKPVVGADFTSSFVYLVGVSKFIELFNNTVSFDSDDVIDISIKPIMNLQLNDAAHPYNIYQVYAEKNEFQSFINVCQFYHQASLNSVHRIFKGCLVEAYLIVDKEITGAKVGAIFWGEEDTQNPNFWKATAVLAGSGLIADLRKSASNKVKIAA